MRIGEKGPRIRDGKRGSDQTFQEARIGPHDWRGSHTKKVRIRSQRGARIGRALRDAYKGLTKIPGNVHDLDVMLFSPERRFSGNLQGP